MFYSKIFIIFDDDVISIILKRMAATPPYVVDRIFRALRPHWFTAPFILKTPQVTFWIHQTLDELKLQKEGLPGARINTINAYFSIDAWKNIDFSCFDGFGADKMFCPSITEINDSNGILKGVHVILLIEAFE
jgi:hypothetical protein